MTTCRRGHHARIAVAFWGPFQACSPAVLDVTPARRPWNLGRCLEIGLQAQPLWATGRLWIGALEWRGAATRQAINRELEARGNASDETMLCGELIALLQACTVTRPSKRSVREHHRRGTLLLVVPWALVLLRVRCACASLARLVGVR